MVISSAARYGSLFCIAAVVSGCAGEQVAPAPLPAAAVRRPARDARPSWVAPDAKKIPLLYVTDLGTGDVYIYAYRTGALKGTLRGFSRPWGLCVDRAGSVYVTDNDAQLIHKYAHGGTKPTATLKDPGETPGGCAVDPTTGDLAIANVSNLGSEPGDVAIYRKGRAPRRSFKDPGINYYEYCSYDNHGNLFVDGQKGGAFVFAELSAVSHAFTDIDLNASIQFGGSVQWDGTQVAVGDYTAHKIDEFDIGPSGATEVGSTKLDGATFAVQFLIDGAKIVSPDAGGADVLFWNYPTGGSPVSTLGGLQTPWGVAVSPAK
ncbi:MAG TPA: hypothetical protein VGG51_04055 [Candidatus Cybelea sp.]